MRVRIWGVRGGIPSPGPETVGLGGNTPCIDVLTSDQQVIIIDAGTGIRRLGKVLQREYPHRIVGTLLISHTHWDHIQGFPFFAPVIGPNSRQNRFVVVGQKRVGQQLEGVLAGQIVEPYLPFAYNELTADIHVKECHDGDVMIVGDDTIVRAGEMSHPGGCLGFRVENQGTVLTYCTDSSHPDGRLNPNVVALARGADLLIHDAQFSLEERRKYPHYGHSSWLEATQVARDAGAKCLALFHYDPEASDAYMASMLEDARAVFPNTVLAREGMEITLPLRDGELPE